MKLQETCDLFESLKTETTKKSEIAVYQNFIDILNKLKSRAFTKDEIQSIESELDSFNFNREKGIKFFKKAFSKFEKYLKDTFSLTTKGFYTKLGLGLGMSFGVLFGVVFLSRFERSLGISLGLCIGMIIGLIIGQSMDTKAKSENRML